MDYGASTRLMELLESATQANKRTVEAETLKSAKAMLRDSDDHVRRAYELLLFKLKDGSSQVRYLALLLVDEIFRRSSLFRGLLVPVLETFLELTVGTRTEKPLPDPRAAAKRLQKKAIEVVERWNADFGSRYRQVRLAYKYLRDVLRIPFPNLPLRAREAEQARREAERAAQEEQVERFRRLEGEWGGSKAEVQALLRQLDESLALLKGGGEGIPGEPPSDQGPGLDTGFDDGAALGGWEEGRGQLLAETAENAAVVESVRDVYRALCQRHLKAAQGWLATLMRGGAPQPPQQRAAHERLLGEVVALRSDMLAAKARCEGLGVELRRRRLPAAGEAEDGEDDEMWEEGEVPSGEPPTADLNGDESEEAQERQALGLVADDEAAAGDAGLEDAVRDLLGVLPGDTAGTPEVQEGEAWVPPQSNLVLKPGGKGLAHREGLGMLGSGGVNGTLSIKRKGERATVLSAPTGRRAPASADGALQASMPGQPAAWVETEAIEVDEPEGREVGPSERATDSEHADRRGMPSSRSDGPAQPSFQARPLPGRSKTPPRLQRDPTRPKEARSANGPAGEASTSKPGAAGSAPVNAGSRAVARSAGGSPSFEELRASAPVVPWGAYLDHWGAEGTVPVDARGLVIENHWGPVDREATLPAERLREMNLRASYYQPEKKEIKACRAPLPGGGLCPRRDLVRCPLHGPVIPRDDQGRPVIPTANNEAATALALEAAASRRQPLVRAADIERGIEGSDDVAAAVSSGAGPSMESDRDGDAMTAEQAELLQSAARQAVENVRKRGREEAEQKQAARKRGGVSARERLADRAHNEAVLREAAVRGSVQRLGEEIGGGEESPGGAAEEAEGAEPQSGRGSKERRRGRGGGRAGAAQLTPRQRIQRRLLSARVRNSTTSYLESEENKHFQTMNANRWENR
ncbi:hypothetical protein KFL_005480080 [Klebsormidium nitens]|uniref:UV-stimulated scaffold protein A C-terminal domain-containing protein n=1 Tax=Klebsormidium nitens TaxID=105231 RepID=A0A1Y1IFM4_KLENI|nr:hypothetical protein KFL_005480080 [Klebsormidium nitens]|eukprot:GAQ89664.1 hypothetical protein KFL_005480080 [Klebsormidium nitens]